MRGRSAWVIFGAGGLTAIVLLAILHGRDATSVPAPPIGPSGAPSLSAPVEPALAIGARVVFALTPATFGEGEVTAIVGERVTVRQSPGQANAIDVERHRMAPLPAGVGDPQPGEYLVCRRAPGQWQGCRVQRVEGSRIVCEDPQGRSRDLEHGTLLRPSPAMAQEIRSYLELHAGYRAFDAAAQTAGQPLRPPAWQPRPGEQVVARRQGTSWYGAVVDAIGVDGARLRGQPLTTTEPVGRHDLAPLPSGPQRVEVGAYVLVRPAVAEGPWQPHRIVSAAPGGYRASDRGGKIRDVAATDVLPLVGGGTRVLDAPFIPTPQEVVVAMLELAEVGPADVVYDLGCGDGRILVAAATKYGARAVGFDIDPGRVAESRERARRHGVAHLVRVEEADILTVDLSEATVVTLYLGEELNRRLLPQLGKLRPGARIVSHAFALAGLAPERTLTVTLAGDSAAAELARPPGDGGETEGRASTLHLWRAPLGAPR